MTPTLPSVTTRALPVLAAASVSAAAGWAVAHPKPTSFAYLGACTLASLLLVFTELRLAALYLWPPLSVIGYPLSGLSPSSLVSFDRIWIGGLVVLLVLVPAVYPPARPTRRFEAALVLLALAIGIRAATTHPDALLALKTWVDALVLPFVMFSLVRRVVARDSGALEKIAFSVMVAGGMLAIIGIGERVVGYDLSGLSGAKPRFDETIGVVRISGPYEAPEPYGLVLVICLAVTLYWIQARGAAGYLTGGVIAGLECMAIGLTFFRVAWIGAIVVFIIALGLRPRRYARVVGFSVMALLFVVLALTQVQRVPAVDTRLHNTENAAGRLASYSQGLEVFKLNPLFGVGYTRYEPAADQLTYVLVNGVRSEPNPHSSYVGTLGETGLLGFIPLLLLTAATVGLVRGFNRVARTRMDELVAATLMAALLGYLLFSLTLTMLPYGTPNMFLIIVLGMAAGRLDALTSGREDPEEDPELPDVRPDQRAPEAAAVAT